MSWPSQDRWQALLLKAGASNVVSDWYDRLKSAYAEPHRHYHNQRHIAECLAEFDQTRSLAEHPIALELALWFHDAVYNPKAGDNEERSASFARQCLGECGVAGPIAEVVTGLIIVTKSHEVRSNMDAQVMVDVDLSIFGRDEERFLEYEDQIRREYEWAPAAVFSAKRAEVLQAFLARPHIFATDWFRGKYEQQARWNLEASIRRLKRMS